MIERKVFSGMRVKSQNEFKKLDEELNLFDEEDWDFFGGVVDTQEENFEFFNDIQDIDFVGGSKSDIKAVLPFASVACLIVVLGVWLGGTILSRKDASYDAFKEQIANEGVVTYHTGEQVESDMIIEFSQILSSYFGTLQSKTGYSNLTDLCLSTSTFEQSYDSSLSKMESAYDKYDCSARAFQEFGSYIKLNKITNAVYEDDIYYVYCDLTVPSKDDVYEYIHLYSYNLTKYFTSNEADEQSIAKFLLDTMTSCPMPCTSEETCIKFTKASDGSLRIMDDSDITSMCSSAYNYSISQISKILGNNLQDK